MGPLELYLQQRPLSIEGVVLDGKSEELFSQKNRISGVLWLNHHEGAIEFQTNDTRDLKNKEIYCSKTPDFADLSFVVAQPSEKSSHNLYYVTYTLQNANPIKVAGWNGAFATFTYPQPALAKIIKPESAKLDGIKIGKGLSADIEVAENGIAFYVRSARRNPFIPPVSLCQLARHLNAVMTAFCKMPLCCAPIHVGQLWAEEEPVDTFFAIGRLEDGMALPDEECLITSIIPKIPLEGFRKIFENILEKSLTPAYLWREYTIVSRNPVRTMEILLFFLYVAIDKISEATPETSTQKKSREISQKFLDETANMELLKHGDGKKLKKFLNSHLVENYSASAFSVKIKHVFCDVDFRDKKNAFFADKSQLLRDTLMHDGAIVQLLDDINLSEYYGWLLLNTQKAVIRYLTGGF